MSSEAYSIEYSVPSVPTTLPFVLPVDPSIGVSPLISATLLSTSSLLASNAIESFCHLSLSDVVAFIYAFASPFEVARSFVGSYVWPSYINSISYLALSP